MSRLRWLCPFCDYTTGIEASNYDKIGWQEARREIEVLCDGHLDFHVNQMVGEVEDA